MRFLRKRPPPLKKTCFISEIPLYNSYELVGRRGSYWSLWEVCGGATAGFHVTVEYRNECTQHTCDRPEAWDPHRARVVSFPSFASNGRVSLVCVK